MEWNSKVISELWDDGLLRSEDCTLEECQDFHKRVERREPLPDDVWQIGDTARFVRLKDGAPWPRRDPAAFAVKADLAAQKYSENGAVLRGADGSLAGYFVSAVYSQLNKG